MRNKQYKAFIFDFDGVIADSAHIKTDAFVALYDDYPQDVRDQVLAFHAANQGVSRFDKFVHFEKNILGNTDVSQDKLNALSDRFSAIVREKVIQAPLITGVKTFLDHSKTKNIPCFVASATPQDELDIIVREKGLSAYFKTIYGTPITKDTATKIIMKDHDLSPNDIIFFGDAMADYNAARGNNVTFIGLQDRDGNHPFPADTRVIKNFDGIL